MNDIKCCEQLIFFQCYYYNSIMYDHVLIMCLISIIFHLIASNTVKYYITCVKKYLNFFVDLMLYYFNALIKTRA